jgi:hypothetical protein
MSKKFDMTKKQLIALRAKSYDKKSKWYAQDYANLVEHIMAMTPEQLKSSIEHEHAINSVSQALIDQHCQFPNPPKKNKTKPLRTSVTPPETSDDLILERATSIRFSGDFLDD